MKIFKKSKVSKQNTASPSPPAVPPMSDLKSMASQLSLEKEIIKKSFLDQFLSKSEKGPSKHTENHDTHAPTRIFKIKLFL